MKENGDVVRLYSMTLESIDHVTKLNKVNIEQFFKTCLWSSWNAIQFPCWQSYLL